MQSIGPCKVEGVRFDAPDTLDVSVVGGPGYTVRTSELGTVEVDISIEVKNWDDQHKLSEAYTAGEEVQFAGHSFRITAYAFNLLHDEKYLELTLRGRAPVERTSEIMAQIGQGDQAVAFPLRQRQSGAETLAEVEERELEKMVRRNRRLGTLDDLA